MREFDEDSLVLGAIEIDLGDAGYLQQTLAHAFGGLLQLRVVGAIAGHRIEKRNDLVDFLGDDRAEQIGRKLALYVSDLLPTQSQRWPAVPGVSLTMFRDLHRSERRLRI